jgi:hypothetical protein
MRLRSGLRRATARTACDDEGRCMIRWMLVIFLALVLINWLQPLLQKLGLGRLPGDFRFRLRGREWSIPLTSTLILSAVASLIARWL